MAVGKEFPLSIILRAVDRATGPIRQFNARIQKVGRNVTKVGRNLTTSLTLPLVALGAAATKAMSDFEAGMSNVATLVDTTTESMEAMGGEVLKIGRRTPVALGDLTSGLYDVRSAGVEAADAMGVLEQSARLGVAGLGTTKEAVDLVTSSINAFGLEGEEADEIYDTIFKTIKNGKTTIQQLSQGFGNVAVQVAESGTEIDEYFASVAALTTGGAKAAQAHTQLRAVFTGLTRDTEHTRKVFRALGAKDFKDLIAQSGGLVPALQRITEELDGNTGEIQKLVGSSEALNAIMAVTGGLNEAYVRTLADMREGANAVDGAFAKQSKTTRALAQRTKNAMASMGVSIGKILAPALERLAKLLQQVADWFAGLDESTKTWIVTIAAVTAAVGPVLMIVGKLISVLALLKAGILIAAGAVKAFAALMMANPIAVAVGAIAMAAHMIYENWEPISEFFEMVWDGVKAAFAAAWEFIKDIVDKVVGAVETVIEKAEQVKEYFAGGSGVTDSPDKRARLMREAGVPESQIQKVTGRGRPTLVDDDTAQSAAARAGGGVHRSEARVKVDIAGAPKGTRVEVDPRSDADVDLTTGYAMGTP